MSSSNSETPDQRENNDTEDSTAMTIEYLRARLLSERSVSRAARLRSEELTKRVVQLEEQLKIVTLQRKRAEKATEEVLAILENHGMSDVSEAIDSSSDEEEMCESNNGSDITNGQECSTSIRDRGVNSSSEVESSPSIGRSLSWKSGRSSQNSSRLKHTDSSRRRYASFAPKNSSTNHMGKSCRRNRRQEISSTVEVSPNSSIIFQNDVSTACSKDAPNYSKFQLHDSGEESQIANDHFLSENGGYHDVEGALHDKEQLIGRYEAEENAQREWEDKFRENNTCSPDSLDPANDSDVTEERDDVKSTGKPCSAAAIIDPDVDGGDTCLNEVSMPKDLSLPPHVHPDLQKKDCEIAHESSKPDAGTSSSGNYEDLSLPLHVHPDLQKKDCDIAHESSKTDAAPSSSGNYGQLQSENHNHMFASQGRSGYSSEDDSSSGNKSRVALVPNGTTNDPGSTLGAHADDSLSRSSSQGALSNGPKNNVESILGACADDSSSQNRSQGALFPNRPTNDVGSILEALEQAKLSLKQKLEVQPMSREGRISERMISPFASVIQAQNRVEIPGIGCHSLFRLPTDLQFEAISNPNSSGSTTSGLNMTDFYPRICSNGYFSKPRTLASNQLQPSFVSSPESISRLHPANFAIKSSADAGFSSSTKFADLDLPFTTYPFMSSRDADLPSSSGFANLDLLGNTFLPFARRVTHPGNHFSPDITPRLPFDVTNLSSLHKNNSML